MVSSTRKIYPFYVLTDLFLIALSFFIPYLLRYSSFRAVSSLNVKLPNFQEYAVIFVLWSILIIITLIRKGFYATDRSLSIPKEISRVSISLLYVTIFVAGLIFFTKYKFFSRQIFFGNFILLCILLAGWRVLKRLILRKLISQGFKNVNILIIGAGNIGKTIAVEIHKNPHWGFKISGFLDDSKTEAIGNLPILGTLNNFIAVAKKYFIDEVIISIPSERRVVSGLIKQAQKMNLGLRIIPDSFEEPLPAVEITHLGLIPLITYKERRHHPAEFVLKRSFDVLASLVLLILLLPLFVIISILIKLNSEGPVFYIRKRSGFKGKIFNFYKFRSMRQDADKLKADLLAKNESQGDLIFKMKKDPRVTPVGGFLRRWSLDELPQILNVLKGDMSLVGPRPFPVEESERFRHEHLQRLTVRPGITGLAQIRGRSDLSAYRWIKWDLWYVNNWSFRLDFLILWWTMPVVLKGKGAY